MADEPQPPAESPPAAAAAGPAEDLYRNYYFKLIIDGVTKGHFTRVDPAPGADITYISVAEGGDNPTVRQLVGPTTYQPVTLWYGLIKADSEPLWQWIMGAINGTVTPKNVSIIYLGPGGNGDRARYELSAAWPIAWRGGELNALGREIAVERITLIYQSLTRT
jgi:phage tail-like protein